MKLSLPAFFLGIGVLVSGGFFVVNLDGGDHVAAVSESSLVSAPVSKFARLAQSPDTVVIDVRTPEEFGAGHLPGAVNYDFYDPQFRDALEALDRDVSYAIYCRSGNRTGQTLALMRSLGFTDAADLAGGINAWLASGRELCTVDSC